jgi:hypothetical protein
MNPDLYREKDSESKKTAGVATENCLNKGAHPKSL